MLWRIDWFELTIAKNQMHRKLSGSSYLPKAGHTFVACLSVCRLCSFRVRMYRQTGLELDILLLQSECQDQRGVAPRPVRTCVHASSHQGDSGAQWGHQGIMVNLSGPTFP